jgi:hypothetical protein
MSKLYFNQFDLEFNYADLARDFQLFQISNATNYLAYKDVGLLDALMESPESPPLATAFSGGKGYLLYARPQEAGQPLKARLEALGPQAGLRVEAIEPESIPEHRLWQLFLNACQGTTHPKYRYNNLSGGLFITFPDPKFINKGDQSVVALQIEVQPGNILALKTATFTSMRRYGDLIKNEYGQEDHKRRKKVAEAPRYLFDTYSSAFRRWLGERKEAPGELYVRMRPVARYRRTKSQKNKIDFFSLNPKHYSTTKISLLNSLLFEGFAERFGAYIQFEQIEARQNALHKKFDLRKNQELRLQQLPVQLIDKTGDPATTQALLDMLEQEFGLQPLLADREDPARLNLRFIHDQDYYAREMREDQRRPSSLGCPIQNFTFQEYSETKKPIAYLRKVLQEGQLKYDISRGQLSAFDWGRMKAAGDWHFALAEQAEVEDADELTIYTLRIATDGALAFHAFSSVDAATPVQQRLVEAFLANLDAKGKPRASGLVLDDQGNLNAIEETDLRTFPNLHDVHHRIMKGLDIASNTFDTDDVLAFTDAFCREMGTAPRIEQLLAFLRGCTKPTVSGNELRLIMQGKGSNEIQRAYVEAFHDYFGYWVQHAVRNEQSTAQHSAALVDIHAIAFEYYVLFWSNLDMATSKGHFAKGNVVRRLSPLPGSALIYERLLDLLNVDFVRAASPTVMPFPFKLLREYRQMATKPVSAFGALDLDLDG